MNIFDLQATISLNADGFVSGVNNAQTAFTGLTEKVSPGTIALGTALGNMATKAAGAVVDFGKDVVDSGKAFETGMSQVAATLGLTMEDIENNVDGVGDTFAALKEAAATMGRETIFSSAEAADGLNILAMSGFSAQKAIAMLPDVLHLAAAGSMSMGDAAKYISGSMKGFSDASKDSQYYTDLMAKGATQASTSVGQLGDAMSGGAAGAAAFNQSAESMTIALLRLAEQNEVGSAAATAYSALLQEVFTPKTDEAAAALNNLGVSTYDANGNARDLNDIVNDLNAAMSGMDEATRNNTKSMMFGRLALDAYNKMTVTGVEKQAAWTEALAGASEGAGEAAKQYGTMTENLEGAAKGFDSALSGLKDAVFDKLSSPLQEASQLGADALNSLTSGLESGGFRGALESLGQFAADTFKGMWDNLKLPPELEQVGAFFTGLAESLAPFVELAKSSVSEGFAAIAEGARGLVDAFADADYGKIDGVASAAKRFLDTIGEAAVNKFEAVASLIPAFLDAFKNADIAGTMGEIAQNAQGLFASFLTASAKVITEVTAGVVSFTEGFKDGGGAEALAKVAKSAGELFNSFLIASDTTISAIGTGIRNFLKGFDDYAVGEAVADLAGGVAELFDAVSSTSGAALEDVAKGVAALAESSKSESAGKGASDLAAAFAELGAHVSESLATAIRSVGEAFGGMGQKLGEVVARFGPDIGALGSSLGEFLSVCTTAAQGIVDALQPAWDWINRVFREALQGALTFAIGLVGALVDAFAPLIDIFSNTLSAVINAFKGNWEGVFEDMKSAGMSFVDFVGSLVDLIKRPFEALIPQMQQIGSDIITGLWNGLQSMWDSVSGWFNEKVGGLVSGAKKLLGIGSPSKVFAEIGRFTVQGMEVGWGKEFGRLEDQVAEDIGALSGTARLPFEDSAIGRSSAAGISSMLAANGSGRSTDPIEINLILDGDVAATALYDPLRRTAFQRGQNLEAIYA